MTRRNSVLAAALVLFSAFCFSAETQAGEPRCRHTLGEYTDYVALLAPLASRARQRADENPLHESDAQYYAAELADAQQCVKTLATIAAVSR